MSLKLHVFPPSPRAFKVLALAAHLNIDYQLCLVDFMTSAQKSPEFTRLNPNQRMPVLEEDGFVLWESNAILQYLAAKRPESGLLPADPQQRALVNQWQFWEMAHWDPACAILVFERLVKATFRKEPEDPARVAEGLNAFNRMAAVLEGQLQKTRFVVGEKPTVADFSIGSALITQPAVRFPLEAFPNVQRWYERLSELPGWQTSIVPSARAA